MDGWMVVVVGSGHWLAPIALELCFVDFGPSEVIDRSAREERGKVRESDRIRKQRPNDRGTGKGAKGVPIRGKDNCC